jgi:LysM repeat protein
MRRRMMVLVGIVVASLLVSTSAAAAPAAAAPVWGAPGYHVVRAGETLSSIARWYGVSAWAIASANHLHNPNRIYAGQWLHIPRGYYPPPGGHPGSYPPPGGYWGGRFHVVRYGETMLSIGRLYGMNPWVIASANGIYNLNRICAGQRLVIPHHV